MVLLFGILVVRLLSAFWLVDKLPWYEFRFIKDEWEQRNIVLL